jgi:hypothetical protein
MLTLKRAGGLLLAILVFGVGIFLGARLAPLVGYDARPHSYNTPVLLKQVQTLSQLVTVQYVLEKVVVWNDPPNNILNLLGETSYNHVLLLAHGIVKAGVDLSRLTPEDLRVEGMKVVIALPPPQITDAYLDDTQTKVIERKTGFLRSFDKDLEQTVRQSAVDDLRRAARTGGILKDADERARTQLAGLFLQLGFQQVEFRSPAGAVPNLLNLAPRETGAKPNP